MSSVAPKALNSKGHFKTQNMCGILKCIVAVLKIQTMYSTANGLSEESVYECVCVCVCMCVCVCVFTVMEKKIWDLLEAKVFNKF